MTASASADADIPAGFQARRFGEGFISVNGPLYTRRVDGRFQLGFRVEQRHCNPMGICHGGMMATFCDMLLPLSAHVLSDVGKRFLPTINLQIDYLAASPLGCLGAGRGAGAAHDAQPRLHAGAGARRRCAGGARQRHFQDRTAVRRRDRSHRVRAARALTGAWRWSCTPGSSTCVAATGLSLSPGPNGLLALTHGALHGRRKALYTVAGGTLGFVAIIALSMFGIGALLQSSLVWLAVLKWAGGAYLVWLGIQVWRSPPIGALPGRRRGASRRRDCSARACSRR